MLYFDHNATTPVAPELAEVISDIFCRVYGNASSVHQQGQISRQHLEQARRTIAGFIHGSPPELVFTSGGTESNNLAILGLVHALTGSNKHVITTEIEHPSVLECFRELDRQGVAVTYLRPNRDGLIEIETVRRSIRPDTVLVSIMHANNEIGTIQPVEEISAMLKECRDAGQRIYLHSDGIQALGKIPVDVRQLGVDLYSVSSHKIYAPKGAGALFVRQGTPLKSIQHGGRHERERRAGTENVPAITCFARALQFCGEAENEKVAALRDRFESDLLSALDNVERNGSRAARLPNTSNLLFHGIPGEALLIALDMRGIAVSTGSACSSGSIEPSPVLLAMGRTREEAKSSLRFSFGRYNTPDDVRTLTEAVIACARQLSRTPARERQLVH